MWDHVIKNGTIVTGTETQKGNIYIRDGKIAAITADELPGGFAEITDAKGKYVLPGFIDTHVHSRDGRKGAHHKEDFFYSSMAGACGGITTIYEMPNCNPAIYNPAMLRDLVGIITPKAHTDFGVWGICLGEINNKELPKLDQAGVIGFKYFWGYAIDEKTYQLTYNYEPGMKGIIPPLDNGEVYKIFRAVAETGKVVAIHAEDFYLIKTLTEEVKRGRDRSYQAMLRGRPALAETMVIDNAIQIAEDTGARLHILHVASAGGVKKIREAKARGVNITAETCPHYLALTDEDAKTLGAKMKWYPLIRTKEDQRELWKGVQDGTIDFIASDHAPHTIEEKKKSIWEAPGGMAEIETMSMIMIDAVSRGRITINDLARLMSENPAKIFGVYPSKGSIQVGTDADITIVDLKPRYTFDEKNMHSKVKQSPYHGRTFKGRTVKTILRGRTVSENGEIVGDPKGQFIRP